MKNNAFHEKCSDGLEKQLHVLLKRIYGETVEVENIYFQPDADFKLNNGKKSKQDKEENCRHRILLSFVLPCPFKNLPSNESNGAPKRITRRTAAGEDFDETSGTTSAQLIFDTGSLSDESEAKVDEMKNGISEDLFSCIEDLDLAVGDSGDFGLDSDIWMKLDELVNADSEINPVYFPLSPDKLHATIDEQLNKSSLENPSAADFKTSLFNDVVESDGIPGSSSDVKLEAVSSASSNFITSIMQASDDMISSMNSSSILISSSVPQQGQYQHQGDGIVQVTDNLGQQFTYSVATSTETQNALRPAILPAASTLVNGGGGRVSTNAWQNAVAPKTGSVSEKIVTTTTRTSKPTIRIIQGHSRPALLVPKSGSNSLALSTTGVNSFSGQIQPQHSVSTTSGVNLRSRKTSPLITKPTTTSMITTRDINNNDKKEIVISIPEGYTHESYILEHGLHKARKLGLHRNTDKDFFPFSCPLCDKKYRNPNGIKYHARYAHGPKCSFNCDLCGKTYATRHGLAAHRRAHESARVAIEKGDDEDRSRGNLASIRPASSTSLTVVKLEPYEEDNANGLKAIEYPTSVTLTAIKTEPMDFDLD